METELATAAKSKAKLAKGQESSGGASAAPDAEPEYRATFPLSLSNLMGVLYRMGPGTKWGSEKKIDDPLYTEEEVRRAEEYIDATCELRQDFGELFMDDPVYSRCIAVANQLELDDPRIPVFIEEHKAMRGKASIDHAVCLETVPMLRQWLKTEMARNDAKETDSTCLDFALDLFASETPTARRSSISALLKRDSRVGWKPWVMLLIEEWFEYQQALAPFMVELAKRGNESGEGMLDLIIELAQAEKAKLAGKN